MKVICLNCRSAWILVAFKGDKSRVDKDARRVVTRCSVCCDTEAYGLQRVPRNEDEKRELRIIVLHDHLWPQWKAKCLRGRRELGKELMCTTCTLKDPVDPGYCTLGREYSEALLARGSDAPGYKSPGLQVDVDDDGGLGDDYA